MYGLAARAVRDLGRRAHLSLPAAAGGALPRRHARSPPTTSRSRSTMLKDKGHPIITQLLRDFIGAEADGRRDRGAALRARSARATCRCSSPALPIFSQRLLRQAARSTRRRSKFRSAPAPTRSAGSSRAATSNTSASRTGGAPTCRSSRGQNNFDTRALRILPRPRRRLRRLHRQELSVPRGVHLAHLGDALRLSRRSRTAASSASAARRHAVRRAGLVHQHAARRSSRTRACARRSIYAFDFEWTNKNIMYGSYERTHSVFQNSDMMATGKPVAGGAGAARAVPRQGAGRGVRRAVRAAGVATARARTARCCARAAQLLQRGRLGRSRTASASTPRASRSPSSS